MFLGTKSPGNESSFRSRGTFVPLEQKFPRTKGPGNESSRELSVPGNESSGERKLSGTKVPNRDCSFLGMKGLGHEKSRYQMRVGIKCGVGNYEHFGPKTLRTISDPDMSALVWWVQTSNCPDRCRSVLKTVQT